MKKEPELARQQPRLPDNVVTAWRKLDVELRERRRMTFPSGCVVHVHHERFRGYGIAAEDDETPPDKLGVRVESGNVWWYEIEFVVPSPNRAEWPTWIKQAKRKIPTRTPHARGTVGQLLERIATNEQISI